MNKINMVNKVIKWKAENKISLSIKQKTITITYRFEILKCSGENYFRPWVGVTWNCMQRLCPLLSGKTYKILAVSCNNYVGLVGTAETQG